MELQSGMKKAAQRVISTYVYLTHWLSRC